MKIYFSRDKVYLKSFDLSVPYTKMYTTLVTTPPMGEFGPSPMEKCICIFLFSTGNLLVTGRSKHVQVKSKGCVTQYISRILHKWSKANIRGKSDVVKDRSIHITQHTILKLWRNHA